MVAVQNPCRLLNADFPTSNFLPIVIQPIRIGIVELDSSDCCRFHVTPSTITCLEVVCLRSALSEPAVGTHPNFVFATSIRCRVIASGGEPARGRQDDLGQVVTVIECPPGDRNNCGCALAQDCTIWLCHLNVIQAIW